MKYSTEDVENNREDIRLYLQERIKQIVDPEDKLDLRISFLEIEVTGK